MSTLLTGDEPKRVELLAEMERQLLHLADVGKLTPAVCREVLHFDLIHLDEIPERKH